MVPRWMDLLRPVRFQITPASAALYLDHGRSDAERSIAASVLAEYLGDDPYQIGELILDADAESFRLLFARLSSHPGQAIARLEQELAREPEPRWDDAPLDGLPEPEGELIARIEASEGIVASRFALCQTLPFKGFEALAEGLRPSGYRPIAFRPYRVGNRLLVAAAWAQRRPRMEDGPRSDRGGDPRPRPRPPRGGIPARRPGLLPRQARRGSSPRNPRFLRGALGPGGTRGSGIRDPRPPRRPDVRGRPRRAARTILASAPRRGVRPPIGIRRRARRRGPELQLDPVEVERPAPRQGYLVRCGLGPDRVRGGSPRGPRPAPGRRAFLQDESPR